MSPAPLSFGERLWFAWVCFFRVLFDGAFAGRAFAVRNGMPELPPAHEAAEREAQEREAQEREAVKVKKVEEAAAAKREQESARAVKHVEITVNDAKADVTPALQLLSLLQREGRFVDFLEQDVAGFSDADVGAAARVVHEGCRRALRQHAKIKAVRSEEEGASVTIDGGYDAAEVKLIGNVAGKPPYKGVLRHRGWRVVDLSVPKPTKAHDASVLAPAEVEL